MKSRRITLLYLDGPSHLPLVRLSLGRCGIVDIDLFQHKDLGFASEYESSEELCKQITLMTVNGKVDMVIIGNNRGAGAKKAKAVADVMRGRTIIVSNGDIEGLAPLYKKIGFEHMGLRSKLPELIKDVLDGKRK